MKTLFELCEPRRAADLRGRNLELVEPRLLKQLRKSHIDPTDLGRGVAKRWKLAEDFALELSLLLRTLAPCGGARTSPPARSASTRSGSKMRPSGSVWRCTASTRGAC